MNIDAGNTAWVLASARHGDADDAGTGILLWRNGAEKECPVYHYDELHDSGAYRDTLGDLWLQSGFWPSIGGFIGDLSYFGLIGVGQDPLSSGIPHLAFAGFQMMFAVISVALITGAVVERMKFSAILVFAALWFTLVYCPVAHWVWIADGWLLKLGAVDFAGGTVVHINAGVSALALALLLGPRKTYQDGINIGGHNVPFVVIGAGLLWFGWFGFNAGSALAANGLAASAFMATNTAAAAAALTWMFLSWFYQRPTVSGIAIGAVAGLVAITPRLDSSSRYGYTHRHRCVYNLLLYGPVTQQSQDR
jgi:Amt family ammonium transporter